MKPLLAIEGCRLTFEHSRGGAMRLAETKSRECLLDTVVELERGLREAGYV